MLIRLKFLLIFLLIPSICFGTLDEFGCDDRVKSPTDNYTTGTATSVGDFTLTQTGAGWTVNEFVGMMLQADANVKFWWVIESNTSDTITVRGIATDGDVEECHRRINEENNGTESFAILNQWKIEEVNNRWFWFGPLGNSFFMVGLNGLSASETNSLSTFGYDLAGNSFPANMKAKHGVSTYSEAIVKEIPIIKNVGFNSLVEAINLYEWVPGHRSASTLGENEYLPFLPSIRMHELTLANTDYFTVSNDKMHDAYDEDFVSDAIARLKTYSSSGTDAIYLWNNGRTGYSPRYLNGYENVEYSIAANPYYIGFDTDEEPGYLTSENGTAYTHLGYNILVSAATTPRKLGAIAYLQTKYATIELLNAAWGSAFADWAALTADTGTVINTLLSAEPRPRHYGSTYLESNTTMLADLDLVAAEFWRTYLSKVKTILDTLTTVHKLNVGPGYHGWIGSSTYDWQGMFAAEYYFKGSQSEDGTTKYVDAIGIGDPMHGYPGSTNTDIMTYFRPKMKEMYDIVGLPFWHESCWHTSPDSGRKFTGTVDSVTDTVLTDAGANFNTDRDLTSVNYNLWLYDPSEAYANRRYYRIPSTGSGEDTLTVDVELGPGNLWQWDTTPVLSNSFNTGDTYKMVLNNTFALMDYGTSLSPYIPETQEDRAATYVGFISGMEELQADNGDYIDIGFGHWVFWDYGFKTGTGENRSFGFSTNRGNLYDGSATIANGEAQDCGDFVTPVSAKIDSIYDDIYTLDGGTPPVDESVYFLISNP